MAVYNFENKKHTCPISADSFVFEGDQLKKATLDLLSFEHSGSQSLGAKHEIKAALYFGPCIENSGLKLRAT
jgi:hypothetical protein